MNILKTFPLITFSLLAFAETKPLDEITLSFVGDIMLADGPGKTIDAGKDPLAEFEKYLKTADYNLGNLECAISTKGAADPEKPWSFRAHPKTVSVLKNKFHAVTVANNHSGDYGTDAFLETMEVLKNADLKFFGGGKNLKEAHAPLIVDVKGIKIAFLGYNEFKPRSFEAGPEWPGIAWSEDDQVLFDIKEARKMKVDLVIPFMHWGWESEQKPSDRQWALAKKMIDAGADAVIGSHPHVTQGADLYKNKPIIWSLGNFVFDGFSEGPTRWGWLLQMKFNKKEALSFKILAAHLDEPGTPHPEEAVKTPCWKKGDLKITECLFSK